MPPKGSKGARPASAAASAAAAASSGAPVVRSESLRATETEKHATSKSLYGDHKARIGSNIYAIHDRVRLRAYQGVLAQLKGKVVLHLGCGMGLVAMMAARALAKHVVAVDSSSIVDAAAVVAKQNALENLTFLRGSVRELALPFPKFDVIICEWAGQLLTNEALLLDAIYCREHLLAEGGVMCPDRAGLHLAGVSDYAYASETADYWDGVYGFGMKPMRRLVLEEAAAGLVPRHCVATDACVLHTVDIATLTAEQRAFRCEFALRATARATLHFLTFYVDTAFTSPGAPSAAFRLGFALGGPNAFTEVSVPLLEYIPVNVGDVVRGTVVITPHEKATDIEITAACSNAIANVSTTGKYHFSF